MRDFEGFARRVRSRRYGPRRIQAGVVEVTFHGPFAVLSVGDPGGRDQDGPVGSRPSVSVSADIDDIGDALAEIFDAAEQGRPAELAGTGRLRCGRSIRAVRAGAPLPVVTFLGTAPADPTTPGAGAQLTLRLRIGDEVRTVAAALTAGEVAALAAEARAWVEALMS